MVGTVPAGNAAQAMALMASTVGPYLVTMPDGETTRPNWVIELVERRWNRPELRALRRSRLSDPRPLRPVLDAPRYTPRKGHTVTGETLGLPYLLDATRSWPAFLNTLIDHGLDGVRLQVGIPGPLDVAAFSWANPMGHYGIEASTAATQIHHIHHVTGGRVVFQLEIPLETVAVIRTPGPWRTKVATRLARRLAGFVSACPERSEWIVHLCRGNKHDQPLVSPQDVRGEVELANALHCEWPTGAYPLTAVHFPFGDRSRPAPHSMRYYAPLKDLVIPDRVHTSAGVVRPEADLTQHLAAINCVEAASGRPWGISTPCGLGRREDTVATVLGLLMRLAQQPPG